MAQGFEKGVPKREIIKEAQSPRNTDNLTASVSRTFFFVKVFGKTRAPFFEEIRQVVIIPMIGNLFVAPAQTAIIAAELALN